MPPAPSTWSRPTSVGSSDSDERVATAAGWQTRFGQLDFFLTISYLVGTQVWLSIGGRL